MITRWKKEGVIFAPVGEFVKRAGDNVDVRLEGTGALLRLPRDPRTGGPKGWKLVPQEEAKR